MTEQVSDVDGLVARLERTQTYLDEADARVDKLRAQHAEDAKRIGELERCLETAIAVIDKSGIIWMGDRRARAALNGANGK